jgi:hypothetical protein
MTNTTNNHLPEITPEVGDGTIQISLPFAITWQNKEYEGNFTVYLNKKNKIDDYKIEWSDEIPNFSKLENYMYEELEKKLLKEALEWYNS